MITRAIDIQKATRHWQLQDRSFIWQVAAALIGVLALILASRIDVPMVPVPMSMQTFAVLLIGALYGVRLGTLTILAWLALGALGLPVFAGGTGGMARFVGPTAGYLIAFPIAAACVGWLASRGWNQDRLGWAMGAMLIGHAICLGLGALWLARIIGFEVAMAKGVTPFLLGAVLKSALVVVALRLMTPRQR